MKRGPGNRAFFYGAPAARLPGEGNQDHGMSNPAARPFREIAMFVTHFP